MATEVTAQGDRVLRDGLNRIRKIGPASVMLGAAALFAGAGLVWAVRRASPRLRYAPGWPGFRPHWAPADKSGVGTALSREFGCTSLVWFTLGHGAINEVYHPRLDTPCTRDMALVVAGGDEFVSDERCDAEHRVEYLAEGVPAYRLVNTCKQGNYRIEKTIIAHPDRSAVLQATRFIPLRGSLSDYRLYTVLDPHLGLREGLGSVGRIDWQKGRMLLVAKRKSWALALACSAPWAGGSVGYVGSTSDGWRDIMRHGRLTRHYEYAPRGNVLLTGGIDLLACGGEFILALGFGSEPGEAGHHALASVRDDFSELCQEYAQGWQAWQQNLLPLEQVKPGERDLYRTSTMVLRTHVGKQVPGAIVASLSIPWGQTFSDEAKSPGRGGYHMVWPRDLAQIAGGLLAAGAHDEARRALEYLRDTQEGDGHWAQNLWVGGTGFWSSIQLGQTAMPVLLADLLHQAGALSDAELKRYWPMIRKAAAYILRHGPSTQEERWENQCGFNPYTIGAVIAAQLIAAEMAERQGEHREATFLRDTADAWQASIDEWTYVTNTDIARRVGVPGYYLRIAPPDSRGLAVKYSDGSSSDPRPTIQNEYDPATIVSPDALGYVRFGLRAPNDERIVNTLKVIDAVNKVETPCGPAWHRYTHDKYGEQPDGSPYDGKHGQGRTWPLLTGERAHYELMAGQTDEAVRLLRAMERFAGDGGLIPEQVWDTDDIPQHDLYFGRPSGSAMPLAWAHAEYIKLRRSLGDGRVFDLPRQTVQRYLVDRVESPRVLWRIDHQRVSVPAGKLLRIEVPWPAVIRWNAGKERPSGEIPTCDSGLGIHYVDLPTAELHRGATVRFSIIATDSAPHEAASHDQKFEDISITVGPDSYL